MTTMTYIYFNRRDLDQKITDGQLDILFYAKDLIDTHFFTRMYMYIAITGKNRSNTSISKEKYTFVTNLIDKLYFHAKIKWRAKINC